MSKKISLKPLRAAWAGSKQWVINIPSSISTTGKRQRAFFETKLAADNFAETHRTKLKNFGTEGTSLLSPGAQEQAANALQLLAPYSVSLNEVVTDWIARKEATEASLEFAAVTDLFLSSRKRSPSYERTIKQMKLRLSGLHGKMLNEITPAALTRELDGMPASVRNLVIRLLKAIFSFGIKRDLCMTNPAKKLERAQVDRKEIEIYRPEDVGRILHATETHDPALVPFFAISFYAGLRLAEVQRLDWSAIDLHENFLKLPAAITKTKQGRHIDISENLAAWLKPYRQESGKIVPFTSDVLQTHVELLREHHKVPTIKHGPRHSFASYWLAMHGDIDQLCRYLGHSDPHITFKHYAKAATKRDALKYFSILPASTTSEKIVEFSQGAA